MDVANADLFIVYNELAKQISNMPVSYTGLIDENRQYFLCHVGLPSDLPESAPRENTFCQYALNSTEPLIVADCQKDHRFKNHPIVTGEPFVRFYGGFPIVTQGGLVLGTLCVVDYIEDARLESEQIDLLVKLTGRLAHQLETQSAQREITASKTIDLLNKIQKNLPGFTIQDTIFFLTLIEGRKLSNEARDALVKRELLDKNGVMTLLGRKVQKEIGLDSGIYRRLAIAPDNVQENLDNMLGELGKI
tara:strand:+ start:106 stop:849 length:744 start_codon:yes stop_codon:yes gene_type:complete